MRRGSHRDRDGDEPGCGICGWWVLCLLAAAAACGAGCGRGGEGGGGGGLRDSGPIPVEVAAVERGPIEGRRTFSGTLEAPAQVHVAPETAGRITRLYVDLADVVTRGQVVAELDDDEFRQAVLQAEADLQVAEANRAEALSALEIATRELERIETLRERGIASEAALDTARAEHLGRQASLQVAEARMGRDRAALEATRIRLSYTRITAAWSEGDDERVVAERLVAEGDTVSANTPILTVVEMDPLQGVIHVTERDYGRMAPGLDATLTTDAWPGESFPAHIQRVAPVFRENTRQARIELRVDNADHRLKPGMFVRATVVLQRAQDATLVPEEALTSRNDRTGVFLVGDDGASVRWAPVETGIRDGTRVQVHGNGLIGRVVILGQQFLDHGSEIAIANPDREAGEATESAPES